MQTHVKPLPILGEKEASFDPTTYALRLVICVAYKLVGGVLGKAKSPPCRSMLAKQIEFLNQLRLI